MGRVIEVAVLECDTPMDSIRERHGSFGDMFHRNLDKAIKRLPNGSAKVELKVTKWDVVNETRYPDPKRVDCVLLTGSKHNAFDNDPWIVSLVNYIRKVWEDHPTKLTGSCFGHQIVARAAGAKVGRSAGGWEISCHTIDFNEQGIKLFGKPKAVFHQVHRDAVLTVPEGMSNFASSEKCEIQGLYCAGRVLTVQAHPEFDGDIVSKIIDARRQLGIFDEKLCQDALSRAYLACDDDLYFTVLSRFLLDN